MTTTDVTALIAIIALGLIAWLVIPSWMARRAATKVLRIFREKNAIGVQNAKTIDELGLRPKSLLQRMSGPRDWKPRALDMLIQAGVVQVRDDGKLYITESNVPGSPPKPKA